MALVSLSVHEPERLAALHSYAIPDAPHARRLDIFTRIATRICRTPVGLISLVDRDSVHCKSAIGLDRIDTARLWAPCAYTIQQPGEITVSEDLSTDDRFDNVGMASGQKRIRFFAGAPLCNQDGMSIGALCVIDTKPREPRDDEMELFQYLAGGVAASLEVYRGLSAAPEPMEVDEQRVDEGEPPVSEWELMANWLADAHPECGRIVTDPWVPHYMRHYPKLVERLMIQAGQRVDLDCAIP